MTPLPRLQTVVLCSLLLAGCGSGHEQPSVESHSAASHRDGSPSNQDPISVPVNAGVSNKTDVSELTEKGQVSVIVCEYVVRQELKSHPELVVFSSLKDKEAQALSSRLPKYKFRPAIYAELDKETGDLRDKESKAKGVKLEVGPIEMKGREAFVTVLWGTSTACIFELEKANGWRIRKSETSVLDHHHPN